MCPTRQGHKSAPRNSASQGEPGAPATVHPASKRAAAWYSGSCEEGGK